MKMFLLFCIVIFLNSCGNGDSYNDLENVDSKSEEIHNLHTRNYKDPSNVIRIFTGSPALIAVASNKTGQGISDNSSGEYSFNSPAYPIIVFRNCVVDINGNGIMDSGDDLIPIRMVSFYGSVVNPLTTLLSKSPILEKTLKKVINYDGSFYKDYIEENDVVLTKLSLVSIQIILENKVDEFQSFLENYSGKKALNFMLKSLISKNVLERTTSINVVNFLISHDFKMANQIEKAISSLRKFDNDFSKIQLSQVYDDIFFKLDNIGDNYLISNVIPGYKIDLSDIFKDTDNKNIIFDYSNLVVDSYLHIKWDIKYSKNGDDFYPVRSGCLVNSPFAYIYSYLYNTKVKECSQNSPIVENIGFSNIYNKVDKLYFKYQFFESNDGNDKFIGDTIIKTK